MVIRKKILFYIKVPGWWLKHNYEKWDVKRRAEKQWESMKISRNVAKIIGSAAMFRVSREIHLVETIVISRVTNFLAIVLLLPESGKTKRRYICRGKYSNDGEPFWEVGQILFIICFSTSSWVTKSVASLFFGSHFYNPLKSLRFPFVLQHLLLQVKSKK